ncbi:MAG: hypothetical protein OEQ39_16850 [Gammaproteobacteria bacterium]|nr:hypothetical protein [Gammaproteobacteria bacterium]MDH3464519.1 hypothetical protein [Gammaproteobacteria bacterium]
MNSWDQIRRIESIRGLLKCVLRAGSTLRDRLDEVSQITVGFDSDPDRAHPVAVLVPRHGVEPGRDSSRA